MAALLAAFTFSVSGQGFNIEPNFYTAAVPETGTWKETKAFWDNEVVRLKAKNVQGKAKADVLYALAIALHESGTNDMLELIALLDTAIEMNPLEAKYYAVRGIVKYNWGGYSPDYDLSEGCPDIEKAKTLGLPREMLANESMTDIPKHPNCK